MGVVCFGALEIVWLRQRNDRIDSIVKEYKMKQVKKLATLTLRDTLNPPQQNPSFQGIPPGMLSLLVNTKDASKLQEILGKKDNNASVGDDINNRDDV